MTAMDKLAFDIDKILGPSITSALQLLGNAPGELDLRQQLANVFRVAGERLEDGMQWQDIMPILSAGVTDVMHVVESLPGQSGAQKLALVKQLALALYRFIDKGLDGKQNRIDIPWVPDSVEGFIEEKMLPVLVGFAVEAVVATWNRNKK